MVGDYVVVHSLGQVGFTTQSTCQVWDSAFWRWKSLQRLNSDTKITLLASMLLPSSRVRTRHINDEVRLLCNHVNTYTDCLYCNSYLPHLWPQTSTTFLSRPAYPRSRLIKLLNSNPLENCWYSFHIPTQCSLITITAKLSGNHAGNIQYLKTNSKPYDMNFHHNRPFTPIIISLTLHYCCESERVTIPLQKPSPSRNDIMGTR